MEIRAGKMIHLRDKGLLIAYGTNTISFPDIPYPESPLLYSCFIYYKALTYGIIQQQYKVIANAFDMFNQNSIGLSLMGLK